MTSALERVPPYRVYRDFLPVAEREALLDWTLEKAPLFSAATFGKSDRIDLTFRNALYLREKVERPWAKPLRARIGVMLPQWFEAFGMTPFEVGVIELDLIVYNHGAFYRRHLDTQVGTRDKGGEARPVLPGDRMLTAVYYFNAEPKAFSGGALRLHPIKQTGPDAPFADVEPEQNSLVVFPSWAPHEVLPVACPSGEFRDSRFAINCWVRRARSEGRDPVR